MNKTNDDLLKDLDKVFASEHVSLDEKKRLLKLKKIYLKIKKIDNFVEVEKKLYSNKNKHEKIQFELTRITSKLKNSNNFDPKLRRMLAYYLKIMELNVIKKDDKSFDELLVNLVLIEDELGMSIGLFEEFISYFSHEVDYYSNGVKLMDFHDTQKNLVKEKITEINQIKKDDKRNNFSVNVTRGKSL